MNPYGDNNPNLYPNGTPFQEVEDIDYNIDRFIKEVNGKKPIIIVIGGSQSSAKTTLGISLMDRINLKTGKELVKLEPLDCPQYSQGSKNFMRKINEAHKEGYRTVMWDETASDYRRKRAISNINKTLDEAMDMIRLFKVIVILVYHDFAEIPVELIKKKVVTCLFQNQERDVDKDYVISKIYNYGKMCLIKHNMLKTIIPEYAYSIEPNFHIHFKDLSPERSRQLEQLSSNIKHHLFEKAEISLQGYLSQEDIAEKTGMSKAWVRKTIKKLGIEQVRTIQKVAYYEGHTLEKIRNKIKRKI